MGNRRPRAVKKKREMILFKALVDDLATLGRIVNAIAIEQGLKDGTLKLSDVVRELLNLKMSIESLEMDNFVGLSDKLAKFVSVVEKSCGKKGEACKLDHVSNGLDVLDKITPMSAGSFGDGSNDGSFVQVLAEVKTSYDSAVGLKLVVNSCVDALQKFQDPVFKRTELYAFIATLTEAPKTVDRYMKILANKFTQSKIESLQIDKLKYGIDVVMHLDDLKQISEIVLMNIQLGNLDNVITSTTVFLTEENISKLNRMVPVLIDAGGSAHISFDEKSWTHGFSNGAESFLQLSADMNSDFAKNVIFKYAREEFIKSLTTKVSETGKHVKNLRDAQNSMKVDYSAESGEKLIQELNSARMELESLRMLQPVHGCIRKLFSSQFNDTVSVAWKDEKVRIESLGDGAKSYITYINAIVVKIDELRKLVTSTGESENIIKSIQEYKFLKEVMNELTILKTQLDGLDNHKQMTTWSESTIIKQFAGNDKKPLSNKEISSILQCVHSKEMTSDGKKVIGKRVVLSSLLKLNSKNKNLKTFSNATTRFGVFFNKFKELDNSPRVARSADNIPGLPNASNVSRHLNGWFNPLIKMKIFGESAELKDIVKRKDAVHQAMKETISGTRMIDVSFKTSNTSDDVEELKHTGKNSAFNDIPTLANALEISKNVSDAFSTISNLKDAYSAQSDLKELLKHENIIDDSIKRSSDIKAKENLEIWWNKDTKATLKNITTVADMWNSHAFAQPTNLSGYMIFLDTSFDFDGFLNIDMVQLVDNLIAINSSYPDKDAAERLRNLQLNFANANPILKAGLKSFALIIPFFAELTSFSISTSSSERKEVTSEPVDDEDPPNASIGGIIGGFIAFLVILGIVVFLIYRFGLKKKKSDKNSNEEVKW